MKDLGFERVQLYAKTFKGFVPVPYPMEGKQLYYLDKAQNKFIRIQ
jgi:hypothetical protein